MQSKFPWLKFYVLTLISLVFCAYAASNDVNECSPSCWNPVLLNTNALGGGEQGGTANEEECKALCVNSGTCIGIDWDAGKNSCWHHKEGATIKNGHGVNHWSLANCTDDCLSYCWRPVKVDLRVFGGDWQPNITHENRCKLLCVKTPNCTGIDWRPGCYLSYRAERLTYHSGARHWDVSRNLPTSCQAPVSPTSIVPRTVSNTSAPLRSPTKAFENFLILTNRLEEGTNRLCEPLIAGITVLAVLLGLAILIIIGLSINTVRIGRKSHPRCDIKSVEMDDAYDRLQMDDTNVISEERPYLSRPMAKMP